MNEKENEKKIVFFDLSSGNEILGRLVIEIDTAASPDLAEKFLSYCRKKWYSGRTILKRKGKNTALFQLQRLKDETKLDHIKVNDSVALERGMISFIHRRFDFIVSLSSSNCVADSTCAFAKVVWGFDLLLDIYRTEGKDVIVCHSGELIRGADDGKEGGRNSSHGIIHRLDHREKNIAANLSLRWLGDDKVEKFCNAVLRVTDAHLPSICFRHLDLSYNNISAKGAVAISKLLSSNTCGIENLSLSSNSLGWFGVSKFLPVLKGEKIKQEKTRVSIVAGVKEEHWSHWLLLKKQKQKANRRKQYSFAASKIKSLNLSDNNIGDEGASALAGILEVTASNAVSGKKETFCNGSCGITNLCIAQNGITEKGVTSIANALEKLCSSLPQERTCFLTKLDLSCNPIGDKGAIVLSKVVALRGHPPIKQLWLAQTGITHKGAQAIAWSLRRQSKMIGSQYEYWNSGLLEINLARNKCGDVGAIALAKSLSGNVTLRNCELSYNEINAEGALSLADALIKNKESDLQTLKLWGNSIRDRGAEAFSVALQLPHCMIQVLNIGNNQIGNRGGRSLAAGLVNNRICKSLNIFANEMSTAVVQLIACALLNTELDPETFQPFERSSDQGLVQSNVKTVQPFERSSDQSLVQSNVKTVHLDTLDKIIEEMHNIELEIQSDSYPNTYLDAQSSVLSPDEKFVKWKIPTDAYDCPTFSSGKSAGYAAMRALLSNSLLGDSHTPNEVASLVQKTVLRNGGLEDVAAIAAAFVVENILFEKEKLDIPFIANKVVNTLHQLEVHGSLVIRCASAAAAHLQIYNGASADECGEAAIETAIMLRASDGIIYRSGASAAAECVWRRGGTDIEANEAAKQILRTSRTRNKHAWEMAMKTFREVEKLTDPDAAGYAASSAASLAGGTPSCIFRAAGKAAATIVFKEGATIDNAAIAAKRAASSAGASQRESIAIALEMIEECVVQSHDCNAYMHGAAIVARIALQLGSEIDDAVKFAAKIASLVTAKNGIEASCSAALHAAAEIGGFPNNVDMDVLGEVAGHTAFTKYTFESTVSRSEGNFLAPTSKAMELTLFSSATHAATAHATQTALASGRSMEEAAYAAGIAAATIAMANGNSVASIAAAAKDAVISAGGSVEKSASVAAIVASRACAMGGGSVKKIAVAAANAASVAGGTLSLIVSEAGKAAAMQEKMEGSPPEKIAYTAAACSAFVVNGFDSSLEQIAEIIASAVISAVAINRRTSSSFSSGYTLSPLDAGAVAARAMRRTVQMLEKMRSRFELPKAALHNEEELSCLSFTSQFYVASASATDDFKKKENKFRTSCNKYVAVAAVKAATGIAAAARIEPIQIAILAKHVFIVSGGCKTDGFSEAGRCVLEAIIKKEEGIDGTLLQSHRTLEIADFTAKAIRQIGGTKSDIALAAASAAATFAIKFLNKAAKDNTEVSPLPSMYAAEAARRANGGPRHVAIATAFAAADAALSCGFDAKDISNIALAALDKLQPNEKTSVATMLWKFVAHSVYIYAMKHGQLCWNAAIGARKIALESGLSRVASALAATSVATDICIARGRSVEECAAVVHRVGQSDDALTIHKLIEIVGRAAEKAANAHGYIPEMIDEVVKSTIVRVTQATTRMSAFVAGIAKGKSSLSHGRSLPSAVNATIQAVAAIGDFPTIAIKAAITVICDIVERDLLSLSDASKAASDAVITVVGSRTDFKIYAAVAKVSGLASIVTGVLPLEVGTAVAMELRKYGAHADVVAALAGKIAAVASFSVGMSTKEAISYASHATIAAGGSTNLAFDVSQSIKMLKSDMVDVTSSDGFAYFDDFLFFDDYSGNATSEFGIHERENDGILLQVMENSSSKGHSPQQVAMIGAFCSAIETLSQTSSVADIAKIAMLTSLVEGSTNENSSLVTAAAAAYASISLEEDDLLLVASCVAEIVLEHHGVQSLALQSAGAAVAYIATRKGYSAAETLNVTDKAVRSLGGNVQETARAVGAAAGANIVFHGGTCEEVGVAAGLAAYKLYEKRTKEVVLIAAEAAACALRCGATPCVWIPFLWNKSSSNSTKHDVYNIDKDGLALLAKLHGVMRDLGVEKEAKNTREDTNTFEDGTDILEKIHAITEELKY
eukprot:g2553.t1